MAWEHDTVPQLHDALQRLAPLRTAGEAACCRARCSAALSMALEGLGVESKSRKTHDRRCSASAAGAASAWERAVCGPLGAVSCRGPRAALLDTSGRVTEALPYGQDVLALQQQPGRAGGPVQPLAFARARKRLAGLQAQRGRPTLSVQSLQMALSVL